MQFVLSLLLLIFILQLSSARCYERFCQHEWPFCRECRYWVSMCSDIVIGPGELCLKTCPYLTTERSWNIMTGTGNVKIKRCVYEVCPDTKPYYYGYTCVDSCPSDSPYISPDDQCLPNCTHGLKTYIESVETEGNNVSTKRCVYVCPDRTPYYYKDFCLDHCPSEAFYHDFTNTCFNSCPTGMHIVSETIITALGNETETRRCVLTCPASKPYVYNDTCVESCPSEASYINSMNTCLASCTDETKMLTEVTSTSQGHMIQTRKCVWSCPDSKSYIYEGACVERCPPEASLNDIDNHCLANCTHNTKLFEQTYGMIKMKLCVSVCPDSKPYAYKGLCVISCPPEAFYTDVANMCIANCTGGFKVITEKGKSKEGLAPEIKSCVRECPDMKAYTYEDECVERCPNGTFSDQTKNCLAKCTTGMKKLVEKNLTVHGQTFEAGRCVKACPESKQFVYDDTCVERCPNSTYSDQRKTCLAKCTTGMKKLAEQNLTVHGQTFEAGRCVNTCPESKQFVYDDTCVECCPNGTYSDQRKTCLANCTTGMKKLTEKNLIIHDQTFEAGRCVEACPESKKFVYDDTCVERCPSVASYIDTANTCLASCPTGGMHKLTENKTTSHGPEVEKSRCVKTCPDSQSYILAGKCVEFCPSFAPFTDTLNNCLANCSDGTKQLTVINKTNSQTNRQCVKVCPDSKPYDFDGTCINRCPEEALFISPERQCVRYCNSIIVTKHNERYDERLCVEKCPDFKPYALDALTCVERCPKDKPYIDFAYSGSRLTCTSKCYFLKDNMNCTNKCPDGTKYVDGDKNCLRVNDCPHGTRFRDTMVYKDSGLVQCLEECNNGYVFLKQTCIDENDCYRSLRFVYRGECIEKCPPGFVYFSFPSCASQLVLSLVGAFMFAATTTSLIFCRHDVYSFFIHYHLVWQTLIRGKDISERDLCSSGGDTYTELDPDLESIGEDGTELINSDRMRLLV